jgi:hypothetical protein
MDAVADDENDDEAMDAGELVEQVDEDEPQAGAPSASPAVSNPPPLPPKRSWTAKHWVLAGVVVVAAVALALVTGQLLPSSSPASEPSAGQGAATADDKGASQADTGEDSEPGGTPVVLDEVIVNEADDGSDSGDPSNDPD